MARVALRSYNLEIESMIDRHQLDEAIAHCMHILQTVPKHLATYQLYGKILLEAHRYSDAADIFQRVLSSLPGDFVTHVGMSIIREHEKNLDAAIWHMERAYEVQPANSAVQAEIRRLYAHRDGVEPPRVRMTRGALARMYARGNLFQQAIGELRAAIAEDPSRIDLQVLLAEMFYRNGQNAEAVESCSNVLRKLPFCYDANRILSYILPTTDRASDTSTYRQRLVSLDPYFGKLEPGQKDSSEVPAGAITIERLAFEPGQNLLQTSTQPEWASTLGAAFEMPAQEESMPDWLFTEEEQRTAPPVGAESQPQSSETLPAELSDDMFDLGSGNQDDWMTPAEKPDLAESDETPAWLSGMVSGEPGESPESEALPDWLAGPEPGTSDADTGSDLPNWMAAASLEPTSSVGGETAEDLPDWLAGLDSSEPSAELNFELGINDAQAISEEPPASEVEIPEFLKDAGWGPSSGEFDEAAASTELDWDKTTFPEELTKSPETAASAEIVKGEMPDWLKEIAPSEEELAQAPTITGGDVDVPAWLSEKEPGASDTIISWLGKKPSQPLAEESKESEAPVSIEPDKPAPPSQYKQVTNIAGDETWSAVSDEVDLPGWVLEPKQKKTGITDMLPSWLPASEEPVTATPASEEKPFEDIQIPGQAVELPGEAASFEAEEQPSDELPSWLTEMDIDEVEEETTPIEPMLEGALEEPEDGEIPDWMTTLSDIDASSGLTDEQPVSQPGSIDAESEMASWLTGLNQEEDQPVSDEAEPVTPVEESTNTVGSDWLEKKYIGAETKPVSFDDEDELEPSAEETVASDLPDWLTSMEPIEETPDQPAVEAEAVTPAETPDWLTELEPAKDEFEEPVSETLPEIPDEELALADLPDWLTGMQPTEETPDQPAVEAEIEMPSEELNPDELPAWLISMESVEEDTKPVSVKREGEFETEEPIIPQTMEWPSEDLLPVQEASQGPAVAGPAEFNLEDPDAAMAWLESLARQQGVSDEQLVTDASLAPQTPDWLIQAGKEAEERGELGVYVPGETTQPVETFVPSSQISEEIPDLVSPVEEPEEELLSEEMVEAEIPDWLKMVESEEGWQSEEAEELPLMEGQESETVQMPDWLAGVDTAPVRPDGTTTIYPVAGEQEAPEVPAAAGPAEFNLEDPEAAMAWLESLARQQGVSDEQLVTDASLAPQTPDWLIQAGKEAEERGELGVYVPGETTQPIETFEPTSLTAEPEIQIMPTAGKLQIPDWLREMDLPKASQSSDVTRGPLEVPDWLRSFGAPISATPPEPPESPSIEEVAEEEIEEDLPAWLRDEIEEEAAGTEPEAPTWVQESESVSESSPWIVQPETAQPVDSEPWRTAAEPEPVTDLNTASLRELEKLPGVGFIVAQSIIEHRESQGPFMDKESLRKVPGVDASLYRMIEDRIQVSYVAPVVPVQQQVVEPKSEDEDLLAQARQAMISGDIQRSSELYANLIDRDLFLYDIARDLRLAVETHDHYILWQTLGDAFMHNDEMQDALAAYLKAEELIQ